MRNNLRGATATLVIVMALAGCSGDPEPEPTGTGPTVTITAPATPTTTPSATEEPTETDLEVDNHGSGDLTDAPDNHQIIAAQQVATDFWLALTERTWNHPDGPSQWLTAIAPYTTEAFQSQLEDTYANESGGVEWDDFYFAHGTITAQVRQALFDPGYPFDTSNVTVVVEGASALEDDTYELDPDDSPSQYRPVTLTLTDDGWKVADYGS